MLNLGDVIEDIIDDIIHSLKSYIKGSAEFFGTQHSLISMSIHQFFSGLCTNPQVNVHYYYLLLNLFDLLYNAYWMIILNVLLYYT